MSRASGHKPECPSTSPDPLAADCCCARLSACEQRVRDEIAADGPWFRSVVHQCCEDKQTSYAAGLAAAHDAVAGMVIETVGNSAATVDQALAAIDALREKP